MLWEDPRVSKKRVPIPPQSPDPWGSSKSEPGSTDTFLTPEQEPGMAGEMAEPLHLTEPPGLGSMTHHKAGETLYLPTKTRRILPPALRGRPAVGTEHHPGLPPACVSPSSAAPPRAASRRSGSWCPRAGPLRGLWGIQSCAAAQSARTAWWGC